ncbi:putative quinol monooxygenase [Halopseudomonas sp. SMJS2]|uniref:putative quinol monooxygenase n=1 Tax=Halopseudomonas sp. SMJS2 TaxID=3041098 RepID=UPI0024530111|nr:putative quinol monooxygenase [Halopseudomonas sp. SMJS2]WGK62467.1 putative quinol monooxygenase [Halopseudomonas sp. SMJS2]
MKQAIIARFEVVEKDLDSFICLAKEVMPATRKEEGCELYSFSQDVLEPNVIWICEQWASEQALNNHLQASHIRDFLQAIAGISYESVDVRKYEVDSVGTIVPPSSD